MKLSNILVFKKNTYISIGLLILCILISISFSQVPFFITLFRNKNIEGMESKSYMDDLSGQLCKIEDYLFCNSDKTISDNDKYKVVSGYVLKMPNDTDDYKYKSELKKVLLIKDDNKPDYKIIFKSIMDKIKGMRIQMINDRISESKKKAKESASDPRISESQKEATEDTSKNKKK